LTFSIDELLDAGHFFGLARGGGLQLRVALGAQRPERRVIAAVLLDLMVAQLPDMGDDAVQKGRVVADDEQRHIGVEQKLLEPALRRLVQMVRRLVEHQHVGIREQQVGQGHAHAIAA
jgi:predicted GNAT family N-acyltransferase